MLNPSLSDNIITDTTTTLVVNNIARIEAYGGVTIVNLYSLLTNKLNFRWNSDEDLNAEENDQYIMRAVEDCDITILAWGKAGQKHPRIEARVSAVMSMLEEYRDISEEKQQIEAEIDSLCTGQRIMTEDNKKEICKEIAKMITGGQSYEVKKYLKTAIDSIIVSNDYVKLTLNIA